jgi:hypothetical protein
MFVTNFKYNVQTNAMKFSISCKALICHPETHTTTVEEIEAGASWTEHNGLALAYILKGDLLHLKIPPLGPSLRADRLWQHTCFEAFVALEDKPEYYEFNFAPSGQWAAYRFQRYRDGISLADEIAAPEITVRSRADGLDLHAIVRLDSLPITHPGVRLQLALSAVIEDDHGTPSYWALSHPPGKPDFHHRDSFVLGLDPSSVSFINAPAQIEKR